ncbi:MAG: pyridoxal-phosphate dependent enzyme [Candidatus Poseidoniales archaeon]|nr:MAG: pyridoxal-phosphate dependent enzyme [Candidatus Poseidoniales archaeon]
MALPHGVYEDVVSAIGHTPLVRLNKVTADLSGSEVWAKLERCSPGGSIKDRIGLSMILEAEQKGWLKPGGTIVEGTSGNTGIGLAMVAAQRGYKCVFTMPDKMAKEKIDLLRAMGARVEVCPTAVEKEDPRSYYMVAERLSKEIEGAWYPDQYSNQSNPKAHIHSTGPELWQQTQGDMTHFVATMGTGGTITGCGTYLKSQAQEHGKEAARIVGVDAEGSILKEWFEDGTMGVPHGYKVEGFGEDFIPPATDFSVIDEIRMVDDEMCFRMARRLAKQEGLFCGGSCGGALKIALDIAAEYDKAGKKAKIVVILPDAGNPYLGKVYNDDWLRDNGFDVDGWAW